MRKIIKGREIVESDWVHLEDDDALVAGNVTVSWSRWQREREQILDRTGAVGLRLLGGVQVRELEGKLSDFALIAIHFPKFADGRGYSQARILRDELGYRGELRATGDILQDQMFYLLRCGFDAFEVKEGKSLEEALEAFSDFSVTYQAAADESAPLYSREGNAEGLADSK